MTQNEMEDLCEQAGCPEKIKQIHLALARRGWFSHPTQGFRNWWEPDGVNSSTGAETGGHEEAYRKCVQPETRAWRHYGIKTVVAFNIRRFREEYAQWLEDGSPPQLDDYDGTAAPVVAQMSAFKKIKAIMHGSTLAE